jgi:ribosomal protein S18 acetylase RimI-like enzyme
MLKIRPVESGEREALFDVAQRYWAEIMPHAPVVQNPEMRPPYFAHEFQSSQPGSHLWWAMVDDTRIGFANVELSLDWTDQSWAYVKDLYIEPAWRNQGHGQALVQALIDWLTDQGVYRVDLFVRSDSPTALAFWEAAGFELASYRMRRYL